MIIRFNYRDYIIYQRRHRGAPRNYSNQLKVFCFHTNPFFFSYNSTQHTKDVTVYEFDRKGVNNQPGMALTTLSIYSIGVDLNPRLFDHPFCLRKDWKNCGKTNPIMSIMFLNPRPFYHTSVRNDWKMYRNKPKYIYYVGRDLNPRPFDHTFCLRK